MQIKKGNPLFERIILYSISGIVGFLSTSLFISYLMIVFDCHIEIAVRIYMPIIKLIRLSHQSWTTLIMLLVLLFYSQICSMIERIKKLPWGIELDKKMESAMTLPETLENVKMLTMKIEKD